MIFLTVDALRADRCSVNGYSRPTTPNLERLASRGINCTQAVAPGGFTHICFPSIMTSSKPLSYGGYDTGAKGRPSTVFEKVHSAGYKVSAYCTTHWVCRYHGYGDYIDNEHLLFVLNTLPGTVLALFRSTLALWHSGKITDAEIVEKAKITIGVFFDHMIDYCRERKTRMPEDAACYGGERFVTDGYDFEKIILLVKQHREEFHRDILSYVQRHFYYIPKPHQWIAREWRYKRTVRALFRAGLAVVLERLGGLVDVNISKFAHYRQKRYVDGAAVTNQIISKIRNWDGESPFFIWNHFFDPHIPYCPGTGPNWYLQTPKYLASLGYSHDIDISVAIRSKPKTDEEWHTWSALYDSAILYTDQQIGRIVEALEERKILDNTLLVVCGDHGEELGEHGDISHHGYLYSHSVRVPLLFSNSNLISGVNSHIVELTDVVPTIAAILGIPPSPQWVGSPVWDDTVKSRNEVVLESFFGGNCVFDMRPLYMAARDKRWNFMWKEFRDPLDKLSPCGLQLYDHANDALEQINLYSKSHPEVRRLSIAIVRRLREIHEISEDRINKAFPGISV